MLVIPQFSRSRPLDHWQPGSEQRLSETHFLRFIWSDESRAQLCGRWWAGRGVKTWLKRAQHRTALSLSSASSSSIPLQQRCHRLKFLWCDICRLGYHSIITALNQPRKNTAWWWKVKKNLFQKCLCKSLYRSITKTKRSYLIIFFPTGWDSWTKVCQVISTGHFIQR